MNVDGKGLCNGYNGISTILFQKFVHENCMKMETNTATTINRFSEMGN